MLGGFSYTVPGWNRSCVESFAAPLIQGGLYGLNISWYMVPENFVLS
jgi:hypothetical protein